MTWSIEIITTHQTLHPYWHTPLSDKAIDHDQSPGSCDADHVMQTIYITS